MQKIILHIDSAGEHQEVTLKDEISLGRTDSARIVLPDSGLSRVNTTFFRDGDEVFVVDENSTNGTFVNGEQVFTSPKRIKDRDEITAGNETVIYVEISAEKPVAVSNSPQDDKKTTTTKKAKKTEKSKPANQENKLPMIPIIAGLSVFLLAFFILAGILVYSLISEPTAGPGKPTPSAINSAMLIPMRVIDPLGGQDPEDIDDLIAALTNDVADEVSNTADVDDLQTNMKTSGKETGSDSELIVEPGLFERMIDLAKAPRNGTVGERPPGMNVLPELCCGVPKQVAKLEEMVKGGYTQPLDFADLAERRLDGRLIELPVATQYYVLDVGGNANTSEFNEFSWETEPRAIQMSPSSPKYKFLKQLADKLGYDLNNPKHRQQMKIRLLRMFTPAAKPVLENFSKAYQQKFNRPLRITSLTRSMEYQISLNSNNPNSFTVRGNNSRPPHTSGCAFDLARKQMTAEEQNFLIQEFARLEKEGVLDALIEYNANACFHIFIYPDGKKPKGF